MTKEARVCQKCKAYQCTERQWLVKQLAQKNKKNKWKWNQVTLKEREEEKTSESKKRMKNVNQANVLRLLSLFLSLSFSSSIFVHKPVILWVMLLNFTSMKTKVYLHFPLSILKALFFCSFLFFALLLIWLSLSISLFLSRLLSSSLRFVLRAFSHYLFWSHIQTCTTIMAVNRQSSYLLIGLFQSLWISIRLQMIWITSVRWRRPFKTIFQSQLEMKIIYLTFTFIVILVSVSDRMFSVSSFQKMTLVKKEDWKMQTTKHKVQVLLSYYPLSQVWLII